MWVVITAALAAAAYLAGAAMAQRWAEPSLALPNPSETPPQIAAGWITRTHPIETVGYIRPGSHFDGTLGEDAGERWRFRGRAGQTATIEMWLHPGSGSSVEAELALRLIAPDGALLGEEAGSVFQLPYVMVPNLPVAGEYGIEVSPVTGAPGRYSLLLTLTDASPPLTPGATPSVQPTTMASGSEAVGAVAATAQGGFQWPSHRRDISGWTFHDPRNPGHIGLDIAASMWDPIVTVADGVVTFAEWGGGYGNLVIVQHGDDWRSYYAHLTEIVVEVGQEVRQGELLGGAGTTGYSTGPHLHFELRYQGRPVDPHIYLP